MIRLCLSVAIRSEVFIWIQSLICVCVKCSLHWWVCTLTQLFIEFSQFSLFLSLSLQLSFVFAEFPMILFLNNYLSEYPHTLSKVTQCGKILSHSHCNFILVIFYWFMSRGPGDRCSVLYLHSVGFHILFSFRFGTLVTT